MQKRRFSRNAAHLFFALITPDDQDLKSWEMVNREDVINGEETGGGEDIEEDDMNNSAVDSVVRRRHPQVLFVYDSYIISISSLTFVRYHM